MKNAYFVTSLNLLRLCCRNSLFF